MSHTVARIKPFSLGKIYGLVSATAVLLIGLIVNAFTVFFGQRAMTLSWQAIDFDGQLMMHTLTIRPIQILLLTCIATVIVMVVGFVWGTVLAWLYNFSAGVGGGLQLELMNSGALNRTAVAEAPGKTETSTKKTATKKSKKKSE